MGIELIGGVGLFFSAIVGLLSFLLNKEKKKVGTLQQSNFKLERESAVASTQRDIANNRANMHRLAAITVLKHKDIADKKAKQIEDKIKEEPDGKTFTITS